MLIKPIVFLTFSSLSASLDLKVPTSCKGRIADFGLNEGVQDGKVIFELPKQILLRVVVKKKVESLDSGIQEVLIGLVIMVWSVTRQFNT